MRTVDEQNIIFCDSLLRFVKLDGKSILDVGCGNGDLVRYIAEKYLPEYIAGIEPALVEYWDSDEQEGKNWCVKHGNAYSLDYDDNTFDVVASLSTFEHIGDIPTALSEIKRVLKPYGRFYAEFSPIWTSAAGHHFLHGKDRSWNPEHLLAIPAWGHLYLSEKDMKLKLEKSFLDEKLICKILNFIYSSDYINRYSRTMLSQALANSNMIVRYYEERVSFNRLWAINGVGGSELTEDIVSAIAETKYSVYDLGVVGLRVCLEKYAALP
ncbi:MAG: methyltransferase domain-containing protein [Oscillospiraceae bacterium]|nr:methyltransferase domain-containing protein [Oscillospiraceae bacterium]